MRSSQNPNSGCSPRSKCPLVSCTPLCSFVYGSQGCPNAGNHHELIMTLADYSNTDDLEKTNFKKSFDKFKRTKWIRKSYVPEKDEKIHFPLVHWVCILGKYKLLEFLISECGFDITVKVGVSKQGPLHSAIQYLAEGLPPGSSKEYIETIFGNILDVFLKHAPEVLCEQDSRSGDTILHYLAKKCSSDPHSRMYLRICLVKIKEDNQLKLDKVKEILSATNKTGNSFLHHLVLDEASVESLEHFAKNFPVISEELSKAKNSLGKSPRELALERKSIEMLRALGAPDLLIEGVKKAEPGSKAAPKRNNREIHHGSPSTEPVGTKCDNQTTEVIPVEINAVETPAKFADNSVLLSQPNVVKSLSQGNCETTRIANGKRRASRSASHSRFPRVKKGRREAEMSDSESDIEDEDFNLADDSDDDIESNEEVEVDKEFMVFENGAIDDADRKMDQEDHTKSADAKLKAASEHTPFCHITCTATHHKLLVSLLNCPNSDHVAAKDVFVKQVNEFITQAGKSAKTKVNAGLPDPVASFKYPLVHWVCVLGKFKILAKLAEMKEFNLAVQSGRTGETGLHRMLLSLDEVLKKRPVQMVLEVFAKTLRTLTDSVPKIITKCNNDRDTPFHCLAKIILDCRGEQKMNTYEGYMELLLKELTYLKTSGKLMPDTVQKLLLKTNKNKETFLHILACRHGVGHCVIEKVIQNIEPEIMDLLKETRNASGRTPSDLSEYLNSYEMAEILHPHNRVYAPLANDDLAEVLQTPNKSTPSELHDVRSPPPTLFHPTENPRSPLGEVQDEQGDSDPKGHEEDLLDQDLLGKVVPLTSESRENPASPTVKLLPEETLSIPLPSSIAVLSADASTGTEGILLASSGDLIANTNSPSNATHRKGGSSPSIKHGPSTSVSSSPINLNREISFTDRGENYDKTSTSASVSEKVVLDNDGENTDVPVTSANQIRNSNLLDLKVGVNRIGDPAGNRREGRETLLDMLQAKFQEELTQSEKELKEKQEALVQILRRIEERQQTKQRLLKDLEENWNLLMEDTRAEGVLQAEIEAKEKDCERFKAELEKYSTSLRVLR